MRKYLMNGKYLGLTIQSDQILHGDKLGVVKDFMGPPRPHPRRPELFQTPYIRLHCLMQGYQICYYNPRVTDGCL